MEWFVSEDYTIQNNHLVAVGGVARNYYPTETEEVLSEFAKLSWGDDALTLAFAKQWGHLGGLWEYSDPPIGRLDPLTRMLNASSRKGNVFTLPPAKEPLPAIWREAASIRTCLSLLDYLQNRHDEELSEYLLSIAVPPTSTDKAPATTLSFYVALDTSVPSPVTAKDEGWPRRAAASVIEAVVNRGLMLSPTQTPFQPALKAQQDGSFKLEYSSQGLIQVIYWHLARVAAGEGGRSVGRCEECGQFFQKTHANRRFCPAPSEGVQGESLCALKARQRRHRNRIKGQ